MSILLDFISIILILLIVCFFIKKINLPTQYLSGGWGISKKQQDLLRESMHDSCENNFMDNKK